MKDHHISRITMMQQYSIVIATTLAYDQLANFASAFSCLTVELSQRIRFIHCKRYDFTTKLPYPSPPKHSDDTVTRKGIPRPEYTMSILSRN